MTLKDDVLVNQHELDNAGLGLSRQILIGRMDALVERAKESGGVNGVYRAERMLSIALTLMDLWLVKNTKYKDSFLVTVKKRGLISALTRLEDKWQRFVAMVEGKDNGTEDESLVDTCGDSANYFMMTIDAVMNEGVEE